MTRPIRYTPLDQRRCTCVNCGTTFMPAFEAQDQCCVLGIEKEVAAEPLPRRPRAYAEMMGRRCALETCDRRVRKGRKYCSQAHANMGRTGMQYATKPRPTSSEEARLLMRQAASLQKKYTRLQKRMGFAQGESG